MEDLKTLTTHNNVLEISKALQKISKAIEEQKKDNSKKEFAIEELKCLKEQCLSNHVQLSQMCTQTLYSLVENGILEPANVLTMFITMLSNANTPKKISIVGEGIINLLLLDLKFATNRLKSNDSYVCPFGMKTAQHPIITLIQKKNVDMIDLANKLNGIYNHIEDSVRRNSIEFLRPVFLHVFCNPIQTINIEPIWCGFVKQQKTLSNKSQAVLHEIFTWYRVTPERCLGLSMQLIDVIELFLDLGNIDAALQYQIYLLSLTQLLIDSGDDPRNIFNTTLKTIKTIDQSIDDELVDYMLIILSQIIHNIAPFYLRNVLEVVKVLAEQKYVSNSIIRNMVLDSLVIQLAINGKCLPTSVKIDIEQLIKQFGKCDTTTKNDRSPPNSTAIKSMKNVKYFHPTIAIHFNLVQLSTQLCADLSNSLKQMINFIQSNQQFANDLHFFLRAILLSIENLVPFEMWINILKQLLDNVTENPNMSSNTIYFMLYLLAKETDGRKQLELFRGLTIFAKIKENIPLILNTYRSLSTLSRPIFKTLSIDLHTRLWLVENRTYQFLHNILITDDEKLANTFKWEMNIAKAYAIKEICTHKASQHGTDLVAPLSKILNSSTDDDLARSLALDAVVLLCRSQTVNIVSTWNVLKNAFNSKLQNRTTKSLCDFFGEVPLLKSSSNEYDLLFREALNQLWKFILSSNDADIIQSAFLALRHFDFNDLELKHMPSELYRSIRLPREYQMQIAASHNDPNNVPLTPADVVPFIPGECWIQLFQYIDETATNVAIEFVVNLIELEMLQYRSGVYMIQEGRPEPKEFLHLNEKSPLKAMVKFLITESDDKCDPSTALKCLECISRKFSRPMPPLNWFFLIEFINQGSKFVGCTEYDQFKMRKYALLIAGRQITNSGSAKSIVENYLQSFNVNDNDSAEIQMAFELISISCDGITSRILANFLQNTLDFVYKLSESNQFEDKCHFQQAIDTISNVFERKCLMQENIDILSDEIYRFNDILQIDSKIYDKYANNATKLSSVCLDRLSTPSEWTMDNFKKALILRTKAVSSRKPYTTSTNPWMWLNILIDNAFDLDNSIADIDRKELLLQNVLNLLMNWRNENGLNEWIMQYLSKVQSNFNQEHTKNTIVHRTFLLDLFIFILVVITGTGTFVNDELTFKNRIRWLKMFPEALWFISKQPQWNDQMPRIFEFLYHLKTQQTNLPKEYMTIFGNTLICVKNHEYFLQKSTWNKFISLK